MDVTMSRVELRALMRECAAEGAEMALQRMRANRAWMSTNEVCKLLGVHRSTVYAYYNQGRLVDNGKQGKARRWSRDSINAMLI
jgi:excisionase family DNA binding protein